MKLRYQSLSANDLDQVSLLDSQIIGQPRRSFFEKRLQIATATPEAFVTCAARAGEELKGYAFGRVQNGDFGSSATVAALDVFGVAPASQGQGIGRGLLAGIEERMVKKNILRLRTEIDWTNHAMQRFFAAAGFFLAPIQIIARDTTELKEDVAEMVTPAMDSRWQVHGPGGNDYDRLARDRVQTRSLRQTDLDTVIRLDRHLSGQDRRAYYQQKFAEMLQESGIRISLTAEKKDLLAGFIMARLDYGEFGQPVQTAVIDTLGVDPAAQSSGVGRALLSQLLINLARLQVEKIQTQISWRQISLHKFMCDCGFVPAQRLILEKRLIPQ